MIGFLNGTVVIRDDPHLVVDVGGVGYRVLVTKSVLLKTLTDGQKLKLFTYTHVRDDAIELFGFTEPEDLKLFKHLIGVSGVGPKTAINIFSAGNRQEILQAIIKGDVLFFGGVSRLGKKNAQKIIIELRSKFNSIGDLDLSATEGNQEEVVEGLKAFGFSAKEAKNALKEIGGKGETIEEKIRLALKYLGKK